MIPRTDWWFDRHHFAFLGIAARRRDDDNQSNRLEHLDDDCDLRN